jgi:DNA-binding IclR family transcriptional regulator
VTDSWRDAGSEDETDRGNAVAVDTVKSALRALQVLEVLTEAEEPVTLAALTSALGVPRSSMYALLQTLAKSGWVEHNEVAQTFSLGIRTLEAGNAYARSLELPERAKPYMERIRDEVNETIQLAILDGRFNVYVAKVDGYQALRLASEVGRRLPAHATGLGKALLAELSPGDLRALFSHTSLERFTQSTITSLAELEEHLKAVRERGYAEDDEEYSAGVRCVAVPVRDHTGGAVAAMSVSAPGIRFDRRRRKEALDLLLVGAADLSSALGYEIGGKRGGTRSASS